MKFITVRDLATKNKETRKLISKEETVLTFNGKPIGFILPTNETDFEFMLKETSAVMARKAVASMQKTGAKGISDASIEKEIQETRKQRKK